MPSLLPEVEAVETGLPMLLLWTHLSTLQVTMTREQLPAMRAEQMVMVEVQRVNGEELVVQVSLRMARMDLLTLRLRLLGEGKAGPMECWVVS